MEKGCPPHECLPLSMGPPMPDGDGMPHKGMSPQPGLAPGPPPAGFQGGPPPGVYHHRSRSPSPSRYSARSTSVQFAPAQTAPVTVVAPDLLQVLPGRTVCQQCQQTVLTDTEYTPGCITWLLCILLASIGCFFCFWVPFFHYGCKDVEHRCPSCNNVIHVHKRCTGYSRPRYASQA
ncbi:lipopolysaccharide-induced tumor necrosis factor-alpha factor homolog [Salarias fasciatus]|uniref:lipopolysaccharide-induced tumor necrosis factor-alpha factor homolog n=1 Tax=Salarias fasciatus TaxID=181472 RepID=UPI001176E5CC|nr:lipopolysaccharide-induced tumor necrosis factor-alpha factor homolog [Salarias fasciatus]